MIDTPDFRQVVENYYAKKDVEVIISFVGGKEIVGKIEGFTGDHLEVTMLNSLKKYSPAIIAPEHIVCIQDIKTSD